MPIYIHPGIPPDKVREAHYDGLPGNLSFTLPWLAHEDRDPRATVGSLAHHPRLQMVIGNMGEAPVHVGPDRRNHRHGGQIAAPAFGAANHPRSRLITTNGFFTMAPFMAALMTFGADRIMFSVDYPLPSNARAGAFPGALPVSLADRAKITHGNPDQLLRLPT